MATLLLFVCAVLACKTQAQFLPPRLPLTTPAPPQICNPPPRVCVEPPQACTTSPQVVTTIVDNSVSNSLANVLQLLIVSNLIENTMKPQCALPAVSVYEPIQTNVYTPTTDCLASQIDYINPYIPYEPIISPITPCSCDSIEIIPNVCYPEVLPKANVGCGPKYGPPNLGCGCDSCNSKFGIQNFGLPKIGCGCDSCGPKIGVQNIGYEILPNVLGPRCGCDGPLFPSQMNCNCGFPNLPVGINVEPLGIIDSCACPNKFGIYY